MVTATQEHTLYCGASAAAKALALIVCGTVTLCYGGTGVTKGRAGTEGRDGTDGRKRVGGS